MVQGVLANVRRDNAHRIVTHTAAVYGHHSSSSTSRLTDIINDRSDATWLNLQRRAGMVSLRHRRSVLEAARRGHTEGTSAEENSLGVQTAPLNALDPSSAQVEAGTSRLRVRSPHELTPASGESSSRFSQAVGTLSTSTSQGGFSRARLPLRSRREIIAGRGSSLESQSQSQEESRMDNSMLPYESRHALVDDAGTETGHERTDGVIEQHDEGAEDLRAGARQACLRNVKGEQRAVADDL